MSIVTEYSADYLGTRYNIIAGVSFSSHALEGCPLLMIMQGAAAKQRLGLGIWYNGVRRYQSSGRTQLEASGISRLWRSYHLLLSPIGPADLTVVLKALSLHPKLTPTSTSGS
jgi:hypothetical protein